MLKDDEILRIVREVATAHLTRRIVQDVLVEPAVDSQGEDALRVTIVIPPGTAATLDGDAVLDNLVDVKRRLRDAGEERFAFIEYATQEELAEIDDPES